jgi:hypothetical protein
MRGAEAVRGRILTNARSAGAERSLGLGIVVATRPTQVRRIIANLAVIRTAKSARMRFVYFVDSAMSLILTTPRGSVFHVPRTRAILRGVTSVRANQSASRPGPVAVRLGSGMMARTAACVRITVLTASQLTR